MSDQRQKFGELIARVWKDEVFKQKFLADPKGTLAEAGIHFPEHVKINVHLDKPDSLNLVIPANPAESEVLDETLDAVSGGTVGSDVCVTADTSCYSVCWHC